MVCNDHCREQIQEHIDADPAASPDMVDCPIFCASEIVSVAQWVRTDLGVGVVGKLWNHVFESLLRQIWHDVQVQAVSRFVFPLSPPVVKRQSTRTVLIHRSNCLSVGIGIVFLYSARYVAIIVGMLRN
jgi:hypothetical protein